ncbi:hypothetical protein MA16_Dca026836 [Dendrobium catenatum]|uniref:Disease resistance protein RPS2 n=1 Tax=Dendrobium catenatum TaxID=906689 RepID=A0A2I0VHG7_9ASPA|nr:hypothetical protein MA16_Dca026836 [Dendrobium catenatum]
MKCPSFGEHFSHLTKLWFEGDILCPLLPPVGELAQLSDLSIVPVSSVKRIGHEFLGVGVCVWDGTHIKKLAFTNLKYLVLRDLSNLEEWTFNKEGEGFEQGRGMTQVLPQLDELLIDNCPRLQTLLECLEWSNMKIVHIEGAHNLREVQNLCNLKEELRLINNLTLERVSLIHELEVIVICDCPEVNFVENIDSPQQLELLDEFMEEIPEWLARLRDEQKSTNDDDFTFKCSNKKAHTRMLKRGLDWPIIQRIPQVSITTNRGSYFLRQTRNPFNCDTNINF